MQITKMRMGREETKIFFCGRREGRRKKRERGKEKYHYLCFFVYVNVFLSLSYLQYLQVLIQNKAVLGRLQAAQSSAGRRVIPGLPEHKAEPGIGSAMGTVAGHSRARALPPLQGPGWAGAAEQGMGHCWRALGVSATRG